MRGPANAAESAFVAEKEREGKLWFSQPKTFTLPQPLHSYRPDFYVVEDKCFYEIIGTRQAYSYQRRFIDAFRLEYPHLHLKVVNSGAWVRGPGHPRVDMPLQGRTWRGGSKFSTGRAHVWARTPAAKEIARALEETGSRNIREFAFKAGISPRALWWVASGRGSGCLVTMPSLREYLKATRRNGRKRKTA